MDTAYDHIQKETYSPEGAEEGRDSNPARSQQNNNLGAEFKEAYQVISASDWGAKLGGFFGQVRKQGETYYEGAKQELSVASAGASKGWTGLVARTHGLSTGSAGGSDTTSINRGIDSDDFEASQTSDLVQEAENILSRFRADAAARLKQIQKAEDAADEALERFGTNVKNFLRDAVTIAPPSEGSLTKQEILFESKGGDGKRVVHATRFEAQLHVIHSRLSSFSEDPDSIEFESWKNSFDLEQSTDMIAQDLGKYDGLRRAMDYIVPEQVSYADFWARYYFLRHVLETEEQKRRNLLRGTQAEEEEVTWDDDEEDDEDGRSNTPHAKDAPAPVTEAEQTEPGAITPTQSESFAANTLLKPNEPRRSNEHSVADSDASYDIVSGAPSRGPGTPREERDWSSRKRASTVAEQSDEEDWE